MGLKPKYEAHHEVRYTNKALRAAVELSAKYINERHLPDKAIDVIMRLVLAVALLLQAAVRKPLMSQISRPWLRKWPEYQKNLCRLRTRRFCKTSMRK